MSNMNKMARVALVFAALACASCAKKDKKHSGETFDPKTLPCGAVIGGAKPFLTIEGYDGVIHSVEVPGFYWDTITYGDEVGDCADATNEEETTDD